MCERERGGIRSDTLVLHGFFLRWVANKVGADTEGWWSKVRRKKVEDWNN